LKEPEDKTVSRQSATRRTRLPVDWVPNIEDLAWAAAKFIATDEQIATEVGKFRDYHHSKGSLMADWAAAWRTWWGNGFHKIPRRPLSNDLVSPPNSALAPYWWRDNPCAAAAIGPDGWRLQINSRPPGPWPVPMLGPPPGSKECLVPPEIVRELRLTERYTAEGSPR
jgi:hypothetical protein